MGVGDEAVGKERMQGGLDAGSGSIGHHAAGHEPHHVGVTHLVGLTQPIETGEREPGEAVASDRAKVGPAALDQERVAGLGRGITSARLYQARVATDEVRKADQAVEKISRVGHGGERCSFTEPRASGLKPPRAPGVGL